MNKIDLQEKTKAEKGKIEIYHSEANKSGGSKSILHRIYIPLESFDSGIEDETQPLETEIRMERLELNLRDPSNLDGINVVSTPEDYKEVSIYVGNSHNICQIRKMRFKKIDENTYEVDCSLFIEFEAEGIAENEVYNFTTQLMLDSNTEEE